MPREIERKFILDRLPVAAQDAPVVRMEQGYLALEAEGNEVRLRRTDEGRTLTVKGQGGLSRRELETGLTPEQFQALWPGTEGRRLRKDRYRFDHQDHTVEIDVYHEPLRGLILAEVEFDSKKEADAFLPPAWMGREVTHLNFLKNRNLLQFESVDSLMEEL